MIIPSQQIDFSWREIGLQRRENKLLFKQENESRETHALKEQDGGLSGLDVCGEWGAMTLTDQGSGED